MNKAIALRLGVLLTLISAAVFNPGCAVMDIALNGNHERVSNIRIEPIDPAPGDIVSVFATVDSTYGYDASADGGPQLTYTVSGGELLPPWTYEMNPEAAGSPELVTNRTRVYWRTPAETSVVTVTACLRDGCKTYKLKFRHSP